MPQNRNLFRLCRFMLLKLPPLLKLISKRRKPAKRVLIIKTDAIGDYILFRNFIQIFKTSEKYKGYQVDLAGNGLWKEIAVNYDSAHINQCYFVQPDALYYRPLTLLKLAWRLYLNNYLLVLQPSSTRTFIADGLAGFTAAKQIIGFDGDTERIAAKYKTQTDRFYTERLLLPPSLIFEFDRSRHFFEMVLGQATELNGPVIYFNKRHKNGIVIFPGAGVPKRSWEADKFLALIKLILTATNQPVYLAGSVNETATGNYLEQNLPAGGVVNLINQTSLIQLIELIGNANLVIANETSAIHIAAATGTQSVCILGGGHFERFAPYPAYMAHQPIGVRYAMDCYHCNWNCKFSIADNEPYPCIGNISLASVWGAVQPIIAGL